MAYTAIYANGSTFNMVKKFVIDSFNEIYNIDTSQLSPGSTAFDISSSKTYMLNNKKQWIEVQIGSSGGAGVPDGGTAGQLLSKTESGTEWIDPPQSGAQSDWNQNDDTQPDYVKNRPFYKSVETENVNVDITWDGNTDGLTPSSLNHYYKVSDSVFTLDQFKQMSFTKNGTDYIIADEIANLRVEVEEFDNGLIAYGSDSIMIATISNSGPHPGGWPDMFPEPGVYFSSDGSITRLYSKNPIEFSKIILKKIDADVLPNSVLNRMSAENPVGTGSFRLNGQDNSPIGDFSFAAGRYTIASGVDSHAEGYSTTASGLVSHAEGHGTTASGDYSHAEGWLTTASGAKSHAEGYYTKASSENQHVQGKYNIEDSSKTYAHIVGNGINDTARSNAHTLDWSGNAWYAGTVEGKALILPSSTENSTKKFRITVDDSGALTATEVT